MIAIKIFSIFTSGTRDSVLSKKLKDNENENVPLRCVFFFYVEEQQDELSKSNFYVVSS